MRKRIPTLMLLAALTMHLAACNDDDPAPAPELEAPAIVLSIPQIECAAEGGPLDEICLEANTAWSLAAEPAFCEVTPASGEAGKVRLTVTAAANLTPEARTEELLFRAVSDGSGTVEAGTAEATLTIRQAPAAAPVYEDLSAEGRANCYLLTAGGRYRFEANNRSGSEAAGMPQPPAIAPASARLVWQTPAGWIGGVKLIEVDGTPCVAFEVLSGAGNAVVAACDAEGEIVWSWHLWMPLDAVESAETAAGYRVMNMNLGALSHTAGDPTSYGMLYQWGRKDPFPAAATLLGTTSTLGAPIYDADGNEVKITNSSWYGTEDNTLAYAVAHPTVCLSNYAQYASTRDWLAEGSGADNLWGNPLGAEKDENNNLVNKGAKSCYDPCPVGWRVPPADVFRHFTTSGGYTWVASDFNVADLNSDGVIDLQDYRYGWHFMVNDTTPMYFPAAARFDGSYAMLMGSMSGCWGSYWGNAPYPVDMFRGGAYSVLSFQIKNQTGAKTVTASPAAGGARADAYSVRCIRE